MCSTTFLMGWAWNMMNWFFRGGLLAVQIPREGVLLAEEPPLWKIAARHFWLADHWLCSLDLIILDEREWFQTGFGGKLYFVVPVISRRNCTARMITNPIQVWSVQPQQKRKTLSYFRWQDASLIEQHCYMDAEKVCLDQEGAEMKLRWWIGIF